VTQAPDWLFLLLVFSLPIVRPLGTEVGGIWLPLTDLLFVLATLAWGLTVVTRRRAFVWSPFYVNLTLYWAALACSVWLSEHPRASPLKLLGVAYLVSLPVLTINLVRSWAFLRAVLVAWTAGAAVTIVCGLLAVALFYASERELATVFGLTHYGSLPAGPYPRITALFLNMNMLCNYLIPSLMLILTMAGLGWLSPAWSRVLQVGTWLVALFTASIGIGGLAIAAGEWRWWRLQPGRRRATDRLIRAAGFATALGLLAAAVALPGSSDAPDALVVHPLGIALEPGPRPAIWRSALETILEHPIAGQGLGTPVASVAVVVRSGVEQYHSDAHNLWLSLAGQGGLLAVAAFALILLSLGRRVLPLPDAPGPAALVKAGLGLSLVGAVAYHGLTGSFEDARHLWVLMGLLVAVDEGLATR
jgi:hypothetical protein